MTEFRALTGLNYRSRVVDELLAGLREVQDKIARFVSEPDGFDLLPALHQHFSLFSHTLELIELNGAAMLSRELDHLIRAIADKSTRDQEEAAVILVQAAEKLPEYLNYINNGSADIPLALLPLLNDIRAIRGASLLSEAVMLLPDFATHQRIKPGSFEKKKERAFRSEVKHARAPLMQALLKWLRGKDVEKSLDEITMVLKGLQLASRDTDLSRLWRSALAVVISLQDGGLTSNASIKMLFGQIERFLKFLMEKKSQAIYQSTPLELFKNLLYYIALSRSHNKKVQKIKASYQLDELLPDTHNRDQVLHALDRPGPVMLKAAGDGIREELSSIKAELEVYAHAEEPQPDILANLPKRLDKLSSTFRLLGMFSVEEINQQLALQIRKLQSEEMVSKDKLVKTASDILRIESALDDHIQSQEQLISHSSVETAGERDLADRLIGNQEFDELLACLLRETMRSLERVKEAYQKVLDLIQTERQLTLITDLLLESSKVLQILPMPELALLLNDLAQYSQSLKLEEATKPSKLAQETFADIIANLEVYIELQIQKQPVMADLLTRSVDALEILSQESQIQHPADTEARDGLQQTGGISELETSGPREHEESLEAEPEMTVIFIEEAMQQFNVISEGMLNIRSDTENRKALESVRRAYHTLKGSGRMVGATKISEFAWANESLLNHVLSGSVAPDSQVLNLLDESIAALPQLVDQLHGASEQVAGIDDLIRKAHHLTELHSPLSCESAPKVPTLAELEKAEIQEQGPPGEEIAGQDNTAAEKEDIPESTDAQAPQMDLTQTLNITGVVESSDTLQLPPMDQADTVQMSEYLPAESVGSNLTLVDNEQPTVRLQKDSSGTVVPEIAVVEDKGSGFDPVLFEIFNAECTQHIETLKEILNKALSGDGKVEPTDTMIRALHTLTGSAQTARAEQVAALLTPVETAVKQKQRAGKRFSRGETLYMSEVVQALELKLEALARVDEEPQFIHDVEARLRNFSERVAAETEDLTATPKLGELQTVFLEEAEDIVEALKQQSAHWKKNLADRESGMELQSILHTLKGSARVASYTGIADLAHAMEDAVQAWLGASLPMETEGLDALDDAIEAVGINLEQARSGDTPGYFDWLISELRAVRPDIRLEPTDKTPEATRIDTTPQVNKATPTETEEAEHLAGYRSDSAIADRIRLDPAIVDRLTDLANESGVYHAHITQYQSKLTESLGELDQTISRLRQQLRELDIESDIHITHAEPGRAGGFDPLEMDKYGRLQEISRSILETFSDLDDIRYSLNINTRHAEAELGEQLRTTNIMQDTLSQIRMVPFSAIVPRLQKVVEDAARNCARKVNFSIEGVDHPIDRSVLKHITSPLEHLLRNAVAHGIEEAGVRRRKGKPETGSISLHVDIDESDIHLFVKDDGAGVDIEKIKTRAVEKQLIEKGTDINDQTLLNLLMKPGFSTARQLDQISGRGVGLDASRRELLKVTGLITLETKEGEGSTFKIRIPQSQFINPVLMVAIQNRRFAMPASRIHGVSRLSREEYQHFLSGHRALIDYQGQKYRSVPLAALLGITADDFRSDVASLVYATVDGEQLAILVNAVIGHMEAVIKPIGQQLAAMGGYTGAFVQSDGLVIPLIDLSEIVAKYLQSDALKTQDLSESGSITPGERIRVMVVDDSITMRKYAERALLRENHQAVLARDGIEAMTLMQQQKPDIILTDLEMPHMDGFELISMIREDPELQALPIIVITSRTADKHREKVEKAGIQGFLGKPYQESELLELIKGITNVG